MQKRKLLTLIAGAAMLAALPVQAQGSFPDKLITFVVPFPPGGPTDAMARILATELTKELGQSVIVDNRAGAGGNIGADAVARATPDGYTIMFGTSGPLAINQSLYKGQKYDARTSFEPIVYVGYLPNILVVRSGLGVANVQELIAKEKAKPGTLNYASSGNGASSHLAGVLFNEMTGTKLLHVPYKGTGPALNDLLGKQVDVMITSTASVAGMINSGQLRALAVTSPRRIGVFTKVPTLEELGMPNSTYEDWYGFFAPAGTPPERVAYLNKAITHTLRTPEVTKLVIEGGSQVVANTSEEFAATLKQDIARWSEVVKLSGAKLD